MNHLGHMEQRLTVRLDQHDKRFDNLDMRIDKLTFRIDDLEENLTRRIDALEEDLVATINDTLKIRTFVGMPLPEED